MLVVGSVNADLVVAVPSLPGPGETVLGGRFERHGGGKGANQAVAAARAGARVTFVGAVGRDDLGEEAVALLAAEGIDVAGLAACDAATGVALIVVDAAGENQIAVAPGANAHVSVAAARAAAGRLAADDVLLLNLELRDEVLMAAALATRARVVLNPAPARPLPDALLDRGPVLTPNAGEARALTGEDDPAAAARALFDRTGAPVLVTVGADGVVQHDADGPARVPAPRVEVVDTTGAGDTFSGVLAAALAAGVPIRAAAERACAAAAHATTVPGAREGRAGGSRPALPTVGPPSAGS